MRIFNCCCTISTRKVKWTDGPIDRQRDRPTNRPTDITNLAYFGNFCSSLCRAVVVNLPVLSVCHTASIVFLVAAICEDDRSPRSKVDAWETTITTSISFAYIKRPDLHRGEKRLTPRAERGPRKGESGSGRTNEKRKWRKDEKANRR